MTPEKGGSFPTPSCNKPRKVWCRMLMGPMIIDWTGLMRVSLRSTPQQHPAIVGQNKGLVLRGSGFLVSG